MLKGAQRGKEPHGHDRSRCRWFVDWSVAGRSDGLPGLRGAITPERELARGKNTERLRRGTMSNAVTASRSSAARTRRYRARRRQEARCVVVAVNNGELDVLIVRGYLPEEERGSGAAIKKAIEAVLSWSSSFC
jgi:hypothetical protein